MECITETLAFLVAAANTPEVAPFVALAMIIGGLRLMIWLYACRVTGSSMRQHDRGEGAYFLEKYRPRNNR